MKAPRSFKCYRRLEIYISLFILFSLIACQKEKLEGEGAVMVGDWRCILVNRLDYHWPNNYYDTTEVYNQSTINMSITFTERGRVCISRDGRRVGSSRIESWSKIENSDVAFSFNCPGLQDFLREGGVEFGAVFESEDNEDVPFNVFWNRSLILLDEADLQENQSYVYYFSKVD